MDTNRNEKTLLVSIYMHLIKKGNDETARVFLEESGLTSEDLGLHVGPDFLKNGWKITFDDSDFASATSMRNCVEGLKLLKMTNPNMAFVDNFIDLDPSSGQNQILPTPQEELANKKPNPLNLGTPGTLSSYKPAFSGDEAGSNLMSMNSAASTFDQQRALTMPNQNMAFDDDFFDFDSLWNDPSAQNQILPTPQEDLANKKPNPLNLGTPGTLSSYNAGAQSNSMTMNSSSSAVLNAISQHLNTEKRKAATELAGKGVATSKKIKSVNNRSSLQEIQKLKSQLICCDFSSDGELLACISKAKTVWLWSMKDYSFVSTPIRSFHPCVRNVRFAPSSSHLAAYNSNNTVELWDAINPKEPLWVFSLEKPLTSMDFNPRNINQLCCADNHEIRLWNVNERTSEVLFKGGAGEVRFQPGDGNMLAAIPTYNEIRLFDVETKSIVQLLKGHGKKPLTVCWDISGRYIASVSEDQALIWSVYDEKPIHEIRPTGKPFFSCTSHPKYPQAFVIGSYQSLEVWNPSVSNGTESVNAHSGHVYAICSSFQAGLIASTSDDNCLKLWK